MLKSEEFKFKYKGMKLRGHIQEENEFIGKNSLMFPKQNIWPNQSPVEAVQGHYLTRYQVLTKPTVSIGEKVGNYPDKVFVLVTSKFYQG